MAIRTDERVTEPGEWIDEEEPIGFDDRTGLTRDGLTEAEYYLKIATESGSSGVTGDSRTVILEPGTVTRGSQGRGRTSTRGTPVIRSVSLAKSEFRGGLVQQSAGAWALADTMYASGYLSTNPRLGGLKGIDAASKAYNKAIDYTADVNLTPEGKSYSLADFFNSPYVGSTGPGDGPGSGSGSSTSKQFITYTKEQARKKAVDAYRSVFGRSPSEIEVTQFVSGLLRAAKAAPSIQKTTGRGGNTNQTTTQGFNEQDWTLGYLSAKIDNSQDLEGAAGVAQDALTALSEEYGIKLSPSLAYDSVRDVVNGTANQDSLAQLFKEQAKILFPHLGEKIDAGFSPRKIADAYINNTTNILEKGPAEVDMFNPYVREAMTKKNDKGEYVLPTADEHAQMLRGKEEWLTTRNGKESLMSAADNILRQMGFE